MNPTWAGFWRSRWLLTTDAFQQSVGNGLPFFFGYLNFLLRCWGDFFSGIICYIFVHVHFFPLYLHHQCGRCHHSADMGLNNVHKIISQQRKLCPPFHPFCTFIWSVGRTWCVLVWQLKAVHGNKSVAFLLYISFTSLAIQRYGQKLRVGVHIVSFFRSFLLFVLLTSKTPIWRVCAGTSFLWP